MVALADFVAASVAPLRRLRMTVLSRGKIEQWLGLGSMRRLERGVRLRRVAVLSGCGLDGALDGAAARHAAGARGCTAADVIDQLMGQPSRLPRR